ncbi:DUF2267 domain-containing protein [Alsobacter sp. KACC 23698]|uniref:DUF2267 domain-containing protein n=1 Tax=Alsobacter sp. KACC 23698 TaxID=3149229 RepID=A0AAU7JIF5_9HYPH
MEDLISRISAASGMDPELARKAVGIILSFLQKEAPAEDVGRMFQAMPGAETLAAEQAGGGGGGGILGAIGGMMGGGGLMALAGQLTSAGLSMDQMQTLGKELFAYGRETAGEDTMGAIVGAVPGLGQFV